MMASSTTIPMARTKPNKVSLLMVKPSGMKKIKVPIMETGMASTGIMVDRQSWRKMNTTSTTSARGLQQGHDYFADGDFYDRDIFEGDDIIHIVRE